MCRWDHINKGTDESRYFCFDATRACRYTWIAPLHHWCVGRWKYSALWDFTQLRISIFHAQHQAGRRSSVTRLFPWMGSQAFLSQSISLEYCLHHGQRGVSLPIYSSLTHVWCCWPTWGSSANTLSDTSCCQCVPSCQASTLRLPYLDLLLALAHQTRAKKINCEHY